MPSARSLLTHALLVVFAVITWWWSDKLFPPEASDRKEESGTIDYYSNAVRRTVYRPDGTPESLLVARSMLHHKADDRTDLDAPVMTLYQENGSPPWVIQSDSGVVPTGGNVLFLNGDVLISKKNEKGEELWIITRNVKYKPHKNYAETAEAVRMTTPTDVLTGKGMQVQLKPALIIKVLSEVRRKHEVR